MLSTSLRHLTLLACFLVAPVLGLASTCPTSFNNSTITTSGGSTSGNGTCTEDGTLIDVSYSYSSSQTGGGPDNDVVFNATATYVGGAALTIPYSFTLDDIQNFDMTTFTTAEDYDSAAGFLGTAGGSSLVADFVVGGYTLPKLIFTADGYQTSPLETIAPPLSSNPVAETFSYEFTFGTGTTAGAVITSTPEPGGVIPVAAILILGLGVPAIRRSRLFSKNMG